jgi:hypothetical protein
LSQWKYRFWIKFKKAHGEKSSADAVSSEQWKSTKLPNLLQKFCADNIYSAYETSLLHRATSVGSLSYKHTNKCVWFKESNVSCNCCAVQTYQELVNGSCWLLGKGLSLDALRKLVWTVDQFSTTMYANKNAWMTSEIFKKWLVS